MEEKKGHVLPPDQSKEFFTSLWVTSEYAHHTTGGSCTAWFLYATKKEKENFSLFVRICSRTCKLTACTCTNVMPPWRQPHLVVAESPSMQWQSALWHVPELEVWRDTREKIIPFTTWIFSRYLRINISAILASLLKPTTRRLGMYPILILPVKGTMWCSQSEKTSTSFTITISSWSISRADE